MGGRVASPSPLVCHLLICAHPIEPYLVSRSMFKSKMTFDFDGIACVPTRVSEHKLKSAPDLAAESLFIQIIR